jgi:mono/diheme cytochrome c family protein
MRTQRQPGDVTRTAPRTGAHRAEDESAGPAHAPRPPAARRALPGVAVLLAAAAAAAVVHGLPPAPAAAQAPPGWPGLAPAGFKLGSDLARGQRIYLTVCATCHGPTGNGRGESALALDPKPTNLTDRRLLARRSDWELYRIVRDGGLAAGLSPAMAGVGFTLPDADIRNVTAYIRTLARK